jgi:hypothetical protein
MNLMRCAVLSVAVLLLSGCALKYREVGIQREYQGLIGTEFVIQEEFLLSGLNAPPGYSNTVDLYLIHPRSFVFKGRELISRQALPGGTRFIVQSIRQPTNILARNNLKCVVRFLNFQTPIPVTVEIALSTLESSLVEKVSRPNQALEPTATAVTDSAAQTPRQP